MNLPLGIEGTQLVLQDPKTALALCCLLVADLPPLRWLNIRARDLRRLLCSFIQSVANMHISKTNGFFFFELQQVCGYYRFKLPSARDSVE